MIDREDSERNRRPRSTHAGRPRLLIGFLKLTLTVLVTWFILRTIDLDLDTLRTADLSLFEPSPILILFASAVLFLGYAISAGLWGRMVRELGGPKIPSPEAVRIFLVANLGRYIPGKVWQLAGLSMLAKQRGVSPAVALAAAALGQGIALLGAAIIGARAFTQLLESGTLPPQVLILLVVGGGLIATAPPVLRACLRLWFRLTRHADMVPPDLGRTFGVRWTIFYTANWVLYATAFWLLLLGLGIEAPYLYATSSFAASYLIGYLAVFAPAGAGVREGVLTVLFTPLVGGGVALTISVIARLWTTLVEVIPAAVVGRRVLSGVDGA